MFIGFMLPAEIRNKIISVYEELKPLDIKLVEPENLHINLKFIGEIESDKIEPIKALLLDLKSCYKAFEVEIGGIGVFPSLKKIRVIWIGIKDGKLKELALFIDKGVASLGIPAETRTFEPHLTLGRVKSDRNLKSFIESYKELQKIAIGKTLINEISLVKSILTPEGPRYEKVFSVNLDEQ